MNKRNPKTLFWVALITLCCAWSVRGETDLYHDEVNIKAKEGKGAKIRKAQYFINLKEWEDVNGNWVYKIGFSADNTVDPRTYFGGDIDLKKELIFMSVKDYDLLWGTKR